MPAPTVYCCSKCDSKGVKLWRQSYAFLNTLELLCRPCAEKDQAANIRRYASLHLKTDQIGNLVPAVPDILPAAPAWRLDPDSTFWGYTSVPQQGVVWWNALEGVGVK